MARMALMTQSCACCWITVPQYGHRALAFTSSGAPHPGQVMRFVSPLSAFVYVPVGRSRSHS